MLYVYFYFSTNLSICLISTDTNVKVAQFFLRMEWKIQYKLYTYGQKDVSTTDCSVPHYFIHLQFQTTHYS